MSQPTSIDRGRSRGGPRRAPAGFATMVLAVSGAIVSTVAAAGPAAASTSTHPIVYVVNSGNFTVSAYDPVAKSIVASIPVGVSPVQVAITPNGNTAYVDNLIGNSVSVIDTATNTVTDTIPVSGFPDGVTVSPDGSELYVSELLGQSVAVISTATNTVTATITVGAIGTGPDDVAFAPNGATAYVADDYGGTVSVIDTATQTVTATIPVGPSVNQLAVSPDGAEVYVSNGGPTGDSLTVIDAHTDKVAATVAVGTDPFGVAAGPDGADVYVASFANSTVSVVDAATDTVRETIPVGANPEDVTMSPDGKRAYVTNDFGQSVSVIDLATGTVTDTISGFSAPIGVAVAAPVPAVTSVSPSSGSPVGGTQVTVTGTGLFGATAVTFGPGHKAAAFSCTDTTCTVTAPPGTAGTTVDVQVATPAGTSAISPADQYTYAAADLAVSLSAAPEPGLPGGHIAYTITVTNNGPSPLTSATVTAPVPTPMSASSSTCTTTGQAVTCALGALASGASTTRSFTVPVGLLSLDTAYVVTATRTSSTPVDLNPANDSATQTCTILTSLIISCY
jgi:uncharacterized repeat protein (TIGR01451 family)